MRYLPVHWSEGMFLRPQHFQAAERYWTELGETAARWAQPYNYGVHSIELSEEAIANYQVQVASCQARMKDGTVVSLEVGQEPDRVELKEAFEQNSVVTVYIAVPKLGLGRSNVSETATSDHRFFETTLALPDESRGGSDQEIQHRQLNVRILLSTDDHSGYEVLPIARIKRAGETEASPQLDPEYVPPVLATDAWTPLSLDIVRSIYDVLGQKIEVLAARAAERGTTLASQEPGDLDDLFMLMALNESHGALSNLTFSKGVHPFLIYTELCRAVGKLSIFDESRRASEFPRYDHDDLFTIFNWSRREIERLINKVRKMDYEQRFFVGAGHGLQVAIDEKWLQSAWDWFIGIQSENLTERECRDLLQPGNLDWKMGSSQQVDLIFKHGLPGVGQTELNDAPHALPSRQDWVYYEITRDGQPWKDVLASQTLALRFREELISNLDNLQGEQKLEVMTDGKKSVLRFALFAVPRR